jgi:hypothetical protein
LPSRRDLPCKHQPVAYRTSHFATARETDEARATSRTPDFQTRLYIPKTYHIVPFTSISRSSPRFFGKHCKAGQTRLAMFGLALMAMRLLP